LFVVSYVGRDELSFGAACAQLIGQQGPFALVAAGDDDCGVLVGEREGGGPADAGQRAGDEHYGWGHGCFQSRIRA
jgi:hypothetical protein